MYLASLATDIISALIHFDVPRFPRDRHHLCTNPF
jgi:hypothetical protein